MDTTVNVGADGVLARWPGYGIVFACGLALPATGSPGYAPGCIFLLVNVGADTNSVYSNRGTRTSSNFLIVTVGA